MKPNDELRKIPLELNAHPEVLEIRWLIQAKEQLWDRCVGIGQVLVWLAPDRAKSWINLAYALHELKRTAEALEALLPAAEKFPEDETVRYNLACYTCQLGRLDDARDWLAQAFRVGDAKELKLQALDDPDLAPIWAGESR